MTEALTEGTELEREIAEFNESWERANDLRSVVNRLPGELVLKSGISARRNNLIERWSEIDTPNLDGTLPEGATAGLKKWCHDAEVIVSYVVQLRQESRVADKKHSDGRVYAGPHVPAQELPQVIDNFDETDGISDSWCWPWETKALAVSKKKKDALDRGDILKIAALGLLGTIAIIAFFEEDVE